MLSELQLLTWILLAGIIFSGTTVLLLLLYKIACKKSTKAQFTTWRHLALMNGTFVS